MSSKVWTGRVDATEFAPLASAEGGLTAIEGDPRARVAGQRAQLNPGARGLVVFESVADKIGE